MTTISQTWNNTCAICDKIALYFKKGLKKWQFARQMSANRIVAEQLIHLGHHNQKEYNQILSKMNDKTIEEYHSKYQEINMWPYTEEENDFISTSQKQDKNDWDYDTYGHGA